MTETTRWREYAQTVGNLKAWLADHPDLPDDTPIILEGDAEGNTHSPLSTIYTGWYAPESTYSGDTYADDKIVTAEDIAGDADVADAVNEGHLHQLGDADARCLVLGPVN